MTDDEYVAAVYEAYFRGYAWLEIALPAAVGDDEMLALRHWVALPELPHGHVLEIGSAYGGTTVALAVANWERGRGEIVVAADPLPFAAHGGEYIAATQGLTLLHQARTHGIAFVCATSDSIRAMAAGARPYRFVFIDGDHEGPWPRRDLENAAALIALGGVIAMHDTHAWASKQVWDEIESAGSSRHGEVTLEPIHRAATLGFLRACAAV